MKLIGPDGRYRGYACDTCRCEFPAFFRLTNELWAELGYDPKALHCIECVAARLGRPFRRADFTPGHELNQVVFHFLRE